MIGKHQKWLIGHGNVFAISLLGLFLALIAGCGLVQPTITAPIVGPVWEWTGTTGSQGDVLAVASPSQYTIQFQTNGRYSGTADCNTITGTYSVFGTSLQIIPGPTSLVGCPPGSLDNQFTNQLFVVSSYVLQGTELTLTLRANAGSMHFRQQGAPPNAALLLGPVWKWRYTQLENGAKQDVPDPTQYTLEFIADGRVQVQADCNQGSGVYTTGANNALTIQINQVTEAACPPGSLSEQYIQQLNAAASYFAGGSDLVINIQKNAARMNFTSGVAAGVTPTTVAQVTAVPTEVPPTALPAAVPPTALPSAIPLTATPVCPGPPTIEFFVASPVTIQRGQSSTLSWGRVTNATSVVIDQGIGGVPAPGSITVVPDATTMYTLLATGCGGQSRTVVTVNVIQPTIVPTVAPTQPPPPTNIPQPTTAPTQPPPPTNPPVPTAVPTQPPPPTEVPEPTVAPGSDLIGFTWMWTSATMNDGTKYTPSNPNQYTIAFNPNGTIAVKADCNQASGNYVVSGNLLTIVITTRTTALCPPDSLSDQYLQLLQQAQSYQVQGSTLTIELQADSGIMTFQGTKG